MNAVWARQRAARRTTAIVVGLAVALLCGYAVRAGAHAFLDHALPAVGSTVHAPPKGVDLWFTQALEPVFSKIEVVDQTGQRVDRGDAKLSADDPTILQVSLTPLPPGTYKVVWRVISVDTHMTEGDYTFRLDTR